jgi:hypothetical protein
MWTSVPRQTNQQSVGQPTGPASPAFSELWLSCSFAFNCVTIEVFHPKGPGNSLPAEALLAGMRLAEGVSVFRLAANKRTSVETLEDYGKKRMRDPQMATELTKNRRSGRTT